MPEFRYLDGEFHCESVPFRKIAEAVGTPCYVYSHARLIRQFRAFDAAFKFAGSVVREHRMGVSVDKSGKNNASTGIDDFGIRGACLLDFSARTHRDNLSVAYADVAVEGAGGCNNVSGGDDGVESHLYGLNMFERELGECDE